MCYTQTMKKHFITSFLLCLCIFSVICVSCSREKGVVTYVAVAEYEMPGFTYSVGMGIEFDQDTRTFLIQKTTMVGDFVLSELAPSAKGTYKGSLAKDGKLILTTTHTCTEGGEWVEIPAADRTQEEYFLQGDRFDVTADDGTVITSFIREP